MICPRCKKELIIVTASWGEKYALCDGCGIRENKEFKKYMKTAINPFAKWEVKNEKNKKTRGKKII